MKRLFSLLAMAFLLTFVAVNAFAQDAVQSADEQQTTEQVAEETTTPAPTQSAVPEDEVQQKKSFHYVLKEKFIEGGP